MQRGLRSIFGAMLSVLTATATHAGGPELRIVADCATTVASPGAPTVVPIVFEAKIDDTSGERNEVSSLDFTIDFDEERSAVGDQDLTLPAAVGAKWSITVAVDTAAGTVRAQVVPKFAVPLPVLDDGPVAQLGISALPSAPTGCVTLSFVPGSVVFSSPPLGLPIPPGQLGNGQMSLDASVTPTVTRTPTPTPLVVPTLPLPHLADPADARSAQRCQAQIGKAGAKFVTSKLKKLDRCLTGIQRCIQTRGGQKQSDCVTKATIKCDKELAKIFTKDEPMLEADIAKKCDSSADLLAPEGLGFASLSTQCQSEFGVALNTVADVAECIRRQKECTVERLFRLQFPRAVELLDTADVNAGLLAHFTCLMGAMGAGGGYGAIDPKGVGKAIDNCAKETKKAGSMFVSSKVQSIEKCLGEVFKCVQTKPGDQACIDKAAGKCANEFGPDGKISKAEEKLRSSVQKKCGPASFSDLAGTMGMNLDDLASVCVSLGVSSLSSLDDYVECLYRQHECLGQEMIRIQVPRVEDLLSVVGFENEITAASCP
jgi:hypothetical protein